MTYTPARCRSPPSRRSHRAEGVPQPMEMQRSQDGTIAARSGYTHAVIAAATPRRPSVRRASATPVDSCGSGRRRGRPARPAPALSRRDDPDIRGYSSQPGPGLGRRPKSVVAVRGVRQRWPGAPIALADNAGPFTDRATDDRSRGIIEPEGQAGTGVLKPHLMPNPRCRPEIGDANRKNPAEAGLSRSG
jgi:hypothetical protein